ncbi:uncharacterized protein [Haliotis cracherodii]|uniref:uncharacterized protein n=1 Tax=Haliotis cracherodii TaxID=6455 RepID=UPI0039E9A385
MPTASQCLILSSLVARRPPNTPYVLSDTPEGDGEENAAPDGTADPANAVVTASQLRASTHLTPTFARTPERPATTHGDRQRSISTSLNARVTVSHSAGDPGLPGPDPDMPHRAGSASWSHRGYPISTRIGIAVARGNKRFDRHREMTSFQKQCMDSVEGSLSPRSTYDAIPTAQDRGSHRLPESYMRNRKVGWNTDTTTAVVSDTGVHGNNAGYSGLRRANTNVLDDARAVATFQRQVVRFDSNVKVCDPQVRLQPGLPLSQPLIHIVDTDVAAAAAATDDLVSLASDAVLGSAGPGEGAADPGGQGQTHSFPMNSPKLFLPVACTDDLRARLYELGWRRPIKPKRKKEEAPPTPTVDLSGLPSLMDLKKDPMLRKARKSRAPPLQSKPPEPNPNAVCFSILGSTLTHHEVWAAFKKDILSHHPEVRVKSLQFIPRAIFIKRPKGGDPIEDRWVITFSSEWFRNRVAGMDLKFKTEAVQLRRYDDVVNCEYRQFTRMNDYMKMVSMKK